MLNATWLVRRLRRLGLKDAAKVPIDPTLDPGDPMRVGYSLYVAAIK